MIDPTPKTQVHEWVNDYPFSHYRNAVNAEQAKKCKTCEHCRKSAHIHDKYHDVCTLVLYYNYCDQLVPARCEYLKPADCPMSQSHINSR